MDTFLLKKWFLLNRRSLPWRKDPTPYEVWVSEIMLQQTQVSVVKNYFCKWMQAFPTLKDLANSSLKRVIKMWEGLGYYSRARNLHLGAKLVLEKYSGELPQTKKELLAIPGIGSYTAGAILSFAFKEKAAAVDGNVKRVLARYFLIEKDISLARTLKEMEALVEKTLPESEPWIVSEALIELGATVCQKKPACLRCPLKSGCQAALHGKENSLPIKSSRQERIDLYRPVALICSPKGYLVRQGEKGKVMADLWEFPYLEKREKFFSLTRLQFEFEQKLLLSLQYQSSLSEVNHTFTRYKAYLYPVLWKTKEAVETKGFLWVAKDKLKTLPFSSGHRQILFQLSTN